MLTELRDFPDLSPYGNAPVGWWFVQGTLDHPTEGPLHFMVAFFDVHIDDLLSRPAHMLLVHVLGRNGKPAAIVSRITPAITEVHQSFAKRIAEANFAYPMSHFVLRRHMHEIFRQAGCDGIETTDDPAQMGPGRLSIRWRDFALEQQADRFSLMLPLGEEGNAIALDLHPERGWFRGSGENLDPSLSPIYNYICCPRLTVSGEVDGRSITGRAWIDRQWGHFDGWFITESDGSLRLLGWDWLGLSLDSGHDLLVTQPFMTGSGPCGDGYVICFDNNSATRIRGRLEADSRKSWTSPRSGVVYPTSQRLIVPERSGDIRIEPVAADQEIPVFGAPAIWEGAVVAEGLLDGAAIRGSGRLELFGYGYADTIGRFIARQIRRGLGA